MPTPKFRTRDYLRLQYRQIADDPESTVEQKFKALNHLEKLMNKFKPGRRKSIAKNLPCVRNKKASPPVEVKKPDDVAGKVDSKLLGAVED
jgi:hypothetical protein